MTTKNALICLKVSLYVPTRPDSIKLLTRRETDTASSKIRFEPQTPCASTHLCPNSLGSGLAGYNCAKILCMCRLYTHTAYTAGVLEW